MIDFSKPGRKMAPSYPHYFAAHPDNIIIRRANILTKEQGRIWWGDLDLTLEMDDLKQLAKDINQEIWILREMDVSLRGREPDWDSFVFRIQPNGIVIREVI